MKRKYETGATNLLNLRKTIYQTIISSVNFEQTSHKLLNIKLEVGQERELCMMLLECCSQERNYLTYYGLLGQKLCLINNLYSQTFANCFQQKYLTIHRIETTKLRNLAKFFGHLLATDALSWHVLGYISLTEEDTTISSRIFIKILFQTLDEQLGIHGLIAGLFDPAMNHSLKSIFPKDNPQFCNKFFTAIGLGGIAERIMAQPHTIQSSTSEVKEEIKI